MSDQSDLRKRILEIQRNESLTPQEKARQIQALMTRNWKPPVAEEQENTKSYNDEAKGVLGCKHYKRNCKLKAFCCEKFFVCRFCHDDVVTDHKIDRYKTEEVQCMQCFTVQPVAPQCSKCGINFGRYFCPICKFYDDADNKQLYHCDKCNMCRVGPKENFFHCDKCGICLNKSLENKHKCLENQQDAMCPICHLPAFGIPIPGIYLPCAHSMHETCHKDYLKTNYTCPLCSKAIVNAKSMFRLMDAEIRLNKLPPEFDNAKSHILCNECETKSDVPFHFIGHKCPKCESYNTRILSTQGLPTGPVTLPAPTVPDAATTEQLLAHEGDGDDDDDDDEEGWVDVDDDDDDESGDEVLLVRRDDASNEEGGADGGDDEAAGGVDGNQGEPGGENRDCRQQ